MLKYFYCLFSCLLKKMNEQNKKKVCVVVLGDIGRSPRMQYHGVSFLDEGYNVQFVGYSGSEPLKKLRESENVKFKYLYECPEFKNYLPTVLSYFFKVLWQVLTLLIALVQISVPDSLLVQNPPAIPALAVCFVYCKICRCKFIIDWHNYAYSILALSLHSDHRLVKISKAFEFYFGKKADSNICVTKAMKEDLKNNYGITSHVFYDRPPDFFKPSSIEEKHKLFLNLGLEYDIFIKDCNPRETIFTALNEESKIVLKKNRPGLLISSTSWTEDENFYLLLKALEEYDKQKDDCDLPNLICAITGRGPLKEFYCKMIQNRNWKNVHIITPWLKAEDYPVLIGSADLGVCLHTSSSGLDLPMKVVDMFGCCVPACAVNFKCISELVKHKENGFIFENELELLQQIQLWFTGFPHSESKIHRVVKENLNHFVSLRWHDNWKFEVQPLF